MSFKSSTNLQLIILLANTVINNCMHTQLQADFDFFPKYSYCREYTFYTNKKVRI